MFGLPGQMAATLAAQIPAGFHKRLPQAFHLAGSAHLDKQLADDTNVQSAGMIDGPSKVGIEAIASPPIHPNILPKSAA